MRHETTRLAVRAAFVLALLFAPAFARAQGEQQPKSSLNSFDRDRGRQMLRLIREDIRKDYYDPTFRGRDLDAHFAAADEQLKQATSLGQMFSIIAQALVDFDDSHLFFLPPAVSTRFDYGWRTQIVGDRCFVTAVKPGSDAERKGLRPGDEVVALDGWHPTRQNQWKLKYLYRALRPQAYVRLVVTKPGGARAQYDIATKVTEGKRILDLNSVSGMDAADLLRAEEDEWRESRDRLVEAGDQLLIWKMNDFDLTPSDVDLLVTKARKRKAFIIDLRGNGGGSEQTLLRLMSNVFDHDVKLGDIRRRSETKPLVAKTRGGDSVFGGDLVVVVDSESGSAAELFARAVQLEKRGTVVGDRTSGAVMRSRFHSHASGTGLVAYYGVSVTDADIMMSDGKSLEHVGVTPDRVVLPTAEDLAAGRDPALSLAASLVGLKLDPKEAGTLFPPRWTKQ